MELNSDFPPRNIGANDIFIIESRPQLYITVSDKQHDVKSNRYNEKDNKKRVDFFLKMLFKSPKLVP
jgi:hypothetical protein